MAGTEVLFPPGEFDPMSSDVGFLAVLLSEESEPDLGNNPDFSGGSNPGFTAGSRVEQAPDRARNPALRNLS